MFKRKVEEGGDPAAQLIVCLADSSLDTSESENESLSTPSTPKRKKSTSKKDFIFTLSPGMFVQLIFPWLSGAAKAGLACTSSTLRALCKNTPLDLFIRHSMNDESPPKYFTTPEITTFFPPCGTWRLIGVNLYLTPNDGRGRGGDPTLQALRLRRVSIRSIIASSIDWIWGSLDDLEVLDISEMEKLTDFSILRRCCRLHTLNLSNCSRVFDLAPLAHCPALTALDLSFCTQLKKIEALGACLRLRNLDLSGCRKLTELSALSSCSSLRHLVVANCSFTVLGELSCSKLETIDLSSCTLLTSLQGLTSCVSLRSLSLAHCEGLEHLEALAALPYLSCLDLSHCKTLRDVTSLGFCSRLQSLDLAYCSELVLIEPLVDCRALLTLNLSHCDKIDLEPLRQCVGLQFVSLSGCVQLSDLSLFSSLRRLFSLDVSGCCKVSDLRPLSVHTRLRNLALENCRAVISVQPLVSCADLRSLNLAFCVGIEDALPLVGCSNLLELDVTGCSPANVSLLQVPTLLGFAASLTSSFDLQDGKSLLDDDPLDLPSLPEDVIGQAMFRRVSCADHSRQREHMEDTLT